MEDAENNNQKMNEAPAAEVRAEPAAGQQAEAPKKRQRKQSAAKEQQAEKKTAKEPKETKSSSILLFDKYSFDDIVINDRSLAEYMNMNRRRYPNIYGRRGDHAYYISHINIVERLVNKLMRGGTGRKVGGKVIRTEGRLQGKKIKTMHIVEDAFSIINSKTGVNPLQKFIEAIEHAAPIEDTTRVRYGGITYNVAVDISSKRRVDVALKNIALAAITGGFNSRRSIAEALAEEIILAANGDPNSYAIKKRTDAERMARSAR